MKKIKYKLLTLATFAIIVAGLFAGCQRTPTITPDETQITVDAAIDGELDAQQGASTKLNASGFEDGDQISFFAVKQTDGQPNLLGADQTTYLNNVLYQRNGGLFKHYDGSTYVRDFFPNDGSSIDTYGLYPYIALITDFESLPFEVLLDQRTDPKAYYASDLMMAKTAGIAPQAVPTRLLFQHLLAKVEVNVKLKNFEAPIPGIEDVRLTNIIPNAIVNLRSFDGTSATVATGVSQPKTIIPLVNSPANVGFNNTYTAIAPPQILTAGTSVIQVTLNTPNKDVYTLKLADNFTLQSGKMNVFDLTVDFGSRPDITANCSIAAWTQTTVDGGPIEKEPDYKFKVVLLNEVNSPSNTKSVKVGVNGNRTFHLTKIKGYVANSEAGLAAIEFAFPGDGNRPGEGAGVKFSLTKLILLDAAEQTIQECVITPAIDVRTMGEMTLYYDMAAQTISTTK